MRKLAGLVFILFILFAFLMGSSCNKSAPAAPKDTLMLDWKPEPEFGGFYQGQVAGAFKKHGLDLEIKSVGGGAPTWQLVANGQTEFATTAADQVFIARAQGYDVVALFAVYQTFPQGIMVHKARGFTRIEDVLTHDGELAAEPASWLQYLNDKFAPIKVKELGYSGGVGVFLAKPDYSQQCFITSEPLQAAAQGGDPKYFAIADAGYNPYTTVVICKGDLVRKDPARVKSMALACREGWRAYLDDPAPANAEMGKLNKEMDAKTFADAAMAQKPLIETDETRKSVLGVMTVERWKALGQQLLNLKVITNAPPAEACFVDIDKIADGH